MRPHSMWKTATTICSVGWWWVLQWGRWEVDGIERGGWGLELDW
jgi:hypothetical protein